MQLQNPDAPARPAGAGVQAARYGEARSRMPQTASPLADAEPNGGGGSEELGGMVGGEGLEPPTFWV